MSVLLCGMMKCIVYATLLQIKASLFQSYFSISFFPLKMRMIYLGLKATGFCLNLFVSTCYLFSFQVSGNDLQGKKNQKNKTHAKHFIFTVDAFFPQLQEIRGKHQISAPTGARVVSSICHAQLSQ